MSPVIFSIGFLEVRWYSVLILAGIIIAYKVIHDEANRFHIKNDFIFNLMFWTLIFGIIGARIYYVAFQWDYYSKHLVEIIQVWKGGLAIHGALIAGLITIIIYSKKHNFDPLKSLDIAVPGLIIAQAIGRWGNFFNSEAYGSAVEYNTLVNMKIIPQFIIDNMYINGAYHLPMFYFESLACIAGFILLLIIRRGRYVKKGQIFGTYIIYYGAIRTVIESFRTDSLMLFNVKAVYIVSAIMFLAGFYIIAVQARKPKLDDIYNSFEDVAQ